VSGGAATARGPYRRSMADRSGVPARTCGRNLARRSIGLGLQLGNYAGVGTRDPHVSPIKGHAEGPCGNRKSSKHRAIAGRNFVRLPLPPLGCEH
jgi:hypothetical protein